MNFAKRIWFWFRSKNAIIDECVELSLLVDALEQSLVDANERLQHNFQAHRESLAAMIIQVGNEVYISHDVLELVRGTEFDISMKNFDDGSIQVSVSPMEAKDEEEGGAHAD